MHCMKHCSFLRCMMNASPYIHPLRALSTKVLNNVRRAEGRAGLREFYPVTLLLTEQELEEGLRRHPNCPPVLPEWLKRDALATHAADE